MPAAARPGRGDAGPLAAAAGRLEAQRRAAQDRLTALEHELSGIVDAAAAANADDEHDPEGATIAYERQHVAALIGQARADLAAAGAALTRIAQGSYGRCETCGRPIGAGRLAARPAAAECIECAARGQRRRAGR